MAKIKVDGMKCMKCVAKVQKAIDAIPGVSGKVDLESKIAEIEGVVNMDVVKTAITALGFDVEVVEE